MAATNLSPLDVENSEGSGSMERRGGLDRARSHLRDPLHRSGYSLVAGSAITSALGMVFWVLAARLYQPDRVGVAAALIAAMGFLASASTLGLRNGFIRFLPSAGPGAGRFIRNGYAVSAAVAGGAALVFVAGQRLWAAQLTMLHDGPLPVLMFTLATMAWTIFVLQDSVLTGLRLATWVPVENSIFAVAKIVLLIALVAVPAWGIFAAWSVPAVLLLLPVNVLIVRRLRSTGDGSDGSGARPHPLSDIVRFAAGDHTAAFLWLATTELIPLVVLGRVGASSSAYYFLSFTIAYSLYLVTSNVSSAFVVEATVHPERESELAERALRQAARLVLPAAVVGVVVAPLLLSLLGPAYRNNSLGLLRLLLLSAIPQMVVGLSVGRLRLHRRIRVVIAVYAVTAVAIFAGSLLIPAGGELAPLGVVWLVTQTLLALVLGPTVLRPDLGRRLSNRLVQLASTVRTAAHQRGRAKQGNALVPRALAAAGVEQPDSFDMLRSHSDVIVARSEIDGQQVIVKVAAADAGQAGLALHTEAVQRVGNSPALVGLHALVPAVLAEGEVDGHAFTIETCQRGRPSDELQGADRAQALALGGAAISALNELTARQTTCDERLAGQLVDGPTAVLREVPALANQVAVLQWLQEWLRDGLLGSQVSVGWTHGDLWAGNILAVVDDDRVQLTGLIDWENSTTEGLGEVDLAHLWLSSQETELGAALLTALKDPSTWPATRTSEDGTVVVGPHGLRARIVLTLAWLHHTAAGVIRTGDRPISRVWLNRNVLPVLDAVASQVAADEERTVAAVAGPEQQRPTVVQHALDLLPTPLRSANLLSLAGVLTAVVAWTVGVSGADPRTMTGFGFLSLFDPLMAGALVLLSVGFVAAWRRDAPGWVLGAHVVALIALIHGTPAVVYDTLRYSWSWKHAGVVDFILRTGSVDTTVKNLTIYHSWPGFFAGSALLTKLAGAPDVLRIATWAPMFFNLANLLALRFLLRSFGIPRRTVWLAIWIFFVTNWVGQDYFSPQAMAFLLYLALIGVVLRGFRSTAPAVTPQAPPLRSRAALAVAVVLLAAIASSHQITPFMAVVALSALALTRRIKAWYLPVLAAGLTVAWAVTVGYGTVAENASGIISSFGKPLANAEETLAKSTSSDASQILVSQVGRVVVLAVAGLAVVGLVRVWRRKRLDISLVVLAAVPATLPLVTEFGGEAIFRVYLFSVPFLAVLAALALDPGPRLSAAHGADSETHDAASEGLVPASRPGPLVTCAAAAMVLLLLAGYLFGYYGKDQQYFFTKEEIAASQWVADTAPPGSLLVEISRNYPAEFKNYENFTYVAIAREPRPSWSIVLARPESKLGEWLADPRYTGAYVLITRGQKIDLRVNEKIPSKTVNRVEGELRESPLFRVAFENRDAVVFELTADQRRPR